MNVLLLSEHYYPKVGGTVSYVENTAKQLAKEGVHVFLLVPASGTLNSLTSVSHQEPNLTILELGVTYNSIQYNGEERTIFCNWVKNHITELTEEHHIEIVHLLFGLFLAEALNTSQLKKMGIKTINTIHNVPPYECSSSWKGDSTLNYYKDKIRKIGVKYINQKRIKKNVFDVYITPSQIVKTILSEYIPLEKIKVIGHGGAEYIQTAIPRETAAKTIHILTVGGLVPHKNQHLIPAIAAHLKKEDINFTWNIIGPARNIRFVASIQNDITQFNISEQVHLKTNVSNEELKKLYQNANLYIQLSSEEGFCMTTLDAIAYGIPTLGTPAGAIPEMLELVEGTVIENYLPTLKPIITHYCKILNHLSIDPKLLNKFKSTYTWKNAATQLISIYNGR
jgi:glycosyltransferase involved in cell wall biosynthesis